jgi:hypothetical protein
MRHGQILILGAVLNLYSGESAIGEICFFIRFGLLQSLSARPSELAAVSIRRGFLNFGNLATFYQYKGKR